MAFAVQHTSRLGATARLAAPRRIAKLAPVRAHKVEIMHEGTTYTLDVPEGQSILEVALDQGLDLPHDCKLGVCMTCPAKLVSGIVDQQGAMLSDDVADKGYALLCMAMPQSDCKITTVTEEELLDEQLVAGEYS
eukprot:GHRQ01013827.1.p1 GENE.GHRQ01013827.1~~GHRQ01013827.1.p1  ORF type:complete len:135 (+),score=44.04 GHRQ01013827.1:208-612(+)